MNRWTKETCRFEALRYNSRKDFFTYNRSAYEYARKNKILDEVCQHMIKLGNRYSKCVYAYEFEDNHVYIGITNNLLRRNTDRLTRESDAVSKHIKLTGLQPTIIQLTDYIHRDDAARLEGEYVKQYTDNNWLILNKAKTGGLGGDTIIWTKEKCLEEALKFETKSDFNLHSKGAYDACRRNGWLKAAHAHMLEIRKEPNYWTKERCKIEASKYKTIGDFKKISGGAYYRASKNNWLNEICQHMNKPEIHIWTLNECKSIAVKYKRRSDWAKGNHVSYEHARKNNWLNICCEHMKFHTRN